ncbi:sulfatase-like hydrolase/transferase [Nocardia sp. NPDC050713]|uniref:sulfatase-like hydrolase/transferase n=1 Tax=Nocardia sp. NPDC050713 TaxID=3154511 RepID=UPI0033C31FF0
MAVHPAARGYESFGGTVGRTTADSTPEWTYPPAAPQDAPNIVVVLVDDMGYSDIGPFGSEIETPTLDRLAANGIRFTNYHTTPLCSPSRASLLTGINAHRAGFGFVANADPGYPGLRLELADDVLTLPEILRHNGYATYAVGKWHLVRDATMNPAAHREPGYEAAEWNSLTDDERRRFARYMEVYAAMVDSIDQSVGRILDTLEQLGELDNTIVVFTSDNGGTAEGGPEGTRSYFAEFAHIDDPDWIGDVPHDEELIGTERLGVHYPRGWGQASNTPFRFYKGQTFAGGVRVPLLVSWPEGLPRAATDNGIRHEYAYVTDLAPTLLELAGLVRPSVRNGLPAKDFDGVSAAELLRDPSARTRHTEQYSEMTGHRGFYRDGWKLLSLYEPGADIDAPNWQLFDVRADPTELHDLSGLYPEKAAELAAAWDESAWANTVFPLFTRQDLAIRRPEEARFAAPVRVLPGTPTLERYRSQRLIAYRDFAITAELGGYRPGDEGVLVAHGDPLGGYLVYLEDGRVVLGVDSYGDYAEAATEPLPPGVRRITVTAAVRPRLRWDFRVEVAGGPSAELRDRVQLVGMSPWTGISVGVDARGPVSWDLRERRGPFRYTGDLRAVTYTPGPIQVPRQTIDAVEREAEFAAE